MTVRVVSRVGSRLPAYCTASGKVHMAFMSEDEINELLPNRQLKGYTSTTITDRETFKELLKTVADKGYALDDEEMDLGVRCVAAPIRDYTRRIVGAISVSGPTMRLSNERIEKEIIPLVQGAAEELSSRLGYHK